MDPLLEPKPLYTIKEAAHALALSRTTIYELIASGELARYKIGNRAVITASSMRAFVQRVEQGLYAPTDGPDDLHSPEHD